MPLHCGVGTRSPTCTSVELGTASGLVLPQPKAGFYCVRSASDLLFYLRVGCQVEKDFLFSSGNWWDLNL